MKLSIFVHWIFVILPLACFECPFGAHIFHFLSNHGPIVVEAFRGYDGSFDLSGNLHFPAVSFGVSGVVLIRRPD
jgi:hypothetical protein